MSGCATLFRFLVLLLLSTLVVVVVVVVFGFPVTVGLCETLDESDGVLLVLADCLFLVTFVEGNGDAVSFANEDFLRVNEDFTAGVLFILKA